MPSKKQRRRRAKELRHDYEYVYVDEEGQEVDPGEVEDGPPPKAPRNAAATKSTAKPRQKTRAQSSVRTVPPPSWHRVLKRSAIFTPFMFLGILLLSRGRLTTVGVVVQTLWLVLLFVPFSYLIDRMMYRRYVRQTDEPARLSPFLCVVVAGAGPRREKEQDSCSAGARDGAALIGLERDERAGRSLDRGRSRLRPHGPLEDDHEGAFLHLVVAQLLSRFEADQDRSTLLSRAENDGRSAPAGGVDLVQRPALHGRILPRHRPSTLNRP
jgi:hypothetical protein